LPVPFSRTAISCHWFLLPAGLHTPSRSRTNAPRLARSLPTTTAPHASLLHCLVHSHHATTRHYLPSSTGYYLVHGFFSHAIPFACCCAPHATRFTYTSFRFLPPPRTLPPGFVYASFRRMDRAARSLLLRALVLLRCRLTCSLLPACCYSVAWIFAYAPLPALRSSFINGLSSLYLPIVSSTLWLLLPRCDFAVCLSWRLPTTCCYITHYSRFLSVVLSGLCMHCALPVSPPQRMDHAPAFCL